MSEQWEVTCQCRDGNTRTVTVGGPTTLDELESSMAKLGERVLWAHRVDFDQLKQFYAYDPRPLPEIPAGPGRLVVEAIDLVVSGCRCVCRWLKRRAGR